MAASVMSDRQSVVSMRPSYAPSSSRISFMPKHTGTGVQLSLFVPVPLLHLVSESLPAQTHVRSYPLHMTISLGHDDGP